MLSYLQQPQPLPQPPHVFEVPQVFKVPQVSEVQAVPEAVEVIPPQPPLPPLPVPVPPPHPQDGTTDPHLPPRCHGSLNSQFSQVILKPVFPVLQLQFAIKKSPFICPPVRARYQDAPLRYTSAGLPPVPDCTIKVSRRHLSYALYYEKRSFFVRLSFSFYRRFQYPAYMLMPKLPASQSPMY